MKKRSETVLQDIDGYLVVQAGKLVSLYGRHNYEVENALEIDELVQRSRIKLWKVLEKKEITCPYPYVRRVVHSEFIDMKRQQKPWWRFSEESEQLEGGTDPEREFMQQTESTILLHSIARMVQALPPRQRLAMLCLLHEYVDDVAQLQAVFCIYNMDLEAAHWPIDKAEKRLLIASLSVARQKMARERKSAPKKYRLER
ncbi:MAG: hypothetical protein PVS3B1_37350 [Ktedonobacteraceae bacterium]